MGNRISLLILCVAAMLASQTSLALGLGDLTLKSHLNQQLDAEIELLEVRELTKEEIIIKLASVEDFDRLSVERSYFLTGIKFDVVLDAPGGPVVRLSTERPVSEPFLDFVLEAHWPTGRFLREYTLLLDLPVFSDEPPAVVSPAQSPSGQNAPSTPKSQASGNTRYNPRSNFDGGRAASGAAPSVASRAPSFTGDSYRVQKNDTLWEIALAVRSDTRFSVHQTMMALHETNPEAFINGNINLLKAGRVLRVPDSSSIQSLSHRQALQQVAEHNASWSGELSAAPIEASRSGLDSYQKPGTSEGRLSLASPDEAFNAEQGRISGEAGLSTEAGKALEKRLSSTQETLDKSQSENRELRSKIDSLEEQIRTLESMISVSSESLRALELAAAENELKERELEAKLQAANEAVAIEVPDEPADFGGKPEVTEPVLSEVGENVGSETVSEITVPVESTPAPQKEVSQPAVETKPEPSTSVVISAPKKQGIVDILMEYIVFIALGAVVFISVVVFFLRRRSTDDDGFDDFLDQNDDFVDEGDSIFEDDAESLENVDEGLAEFPEDDTGADAVEELVEDDSLEPETEDVVAESDIYIAYGKYDQAEEMLLKALDANAGHHEARLKLMELHASQENVDAFDTHYELLLSGKAPSNLVERAEALREGFSDAPDFDASVYMGDDDTALDDDIAEDEDDLSFELDLGGDNAFDEDVSIGSEQTEKTAEGDELDLSALEGDFDDDVLSVEEAESEDEYSLDLDDDDELDLDDDDELGLDLDENSFELDLGGDDDVTEVNPALDLEGLAFDEGDSEVEPASSLDIDDGLDADVEAASGLELEMDISDLASDTDADSDDLSLDLEGLSESKGEANDDSLDFDLEGLDDIDLGGDGQDLDIDLALDTESLDLEDELELGSDTSLSAEEGFGALDLAGLEAESADAEEILLEAPAAIEDDLAKLPDADTDLLEVGGDTDDTVIRSAPIVEPEPIEQDSLEDDLRLDTTSFDLAALDEELDALTSDLSPETGLGDLEDGIAELDSLDFDTTATHDLDALDETLGTLDIAEPDLDFELPEVDASEEPAPVTVDEGTSELSSNDEDTVIRGVSEPEPASRDESGDLDFELPEIDPDATDDDDLDFLSDADEVATKLDLAAAYIDMGDASGAKEIIQEIMQEGSDEQKREADDLLTRMAD